MLFSIVVIPIYIAANSVGKFLFFIHSPVFFICRLSNNSLQDCCEVKIPHCDFDLHFFKNQRYRVSFHVPIDHLYVSFEEMFIQVFCQYFDWVLCFLILSCMNYLYILEINPMSVASFANILSYLQVVFCFIYVFLFKLLSLKVQKLLNLIRSLQFIFVFISITLGNIQKNIAVNNVKGCSAYAFLQEFYNQVLNSFLVSFCI